LAFIAVVEKQSESPQKSVPSRPNKIATANPLRQFATKGLRPEVARFFLVQHTKTEENIQNNHKIYQMLTIYTKCP
jgi:hypothetical protein